MIHTILLLYTWISELILHVANMSAEHFTSVIIPECG